jgi:hypothetical protein
VLKANALAAETLMKCRRLVFIVSMVEGEPSWDISDC